ncbi:MAG: stage II sporulation protein M [Zestosphaera sp.]
MVVSFALGIVSSFTVHPEFTEEFIRDFSRELRPIVESLSVNPLMIVFLNNLRVALISFFLGPTLLIPFLVLYINGYILGAFLTYSPYSITYNLPLILPRGVLELPAIIMSASLGTSISLALLNKYLLKREVLVKQLFIRYVKYLIPITVVLALAAFIEVFITPLVPTALGITS